VDENFSMSVIPERWQVIARELGELCVARNAVLCGAESCTGGLIAATLTSVSRSSHWFDRGFTTYSNEAKMQLLGVLESTLKVHGAVSEATAREMAAGALANSTATISFSVTGVAGPTGGTANKPVGMVCFGFASREGARTITKHFSGDRNAVREQSVEFVLAELIATLKTQA
jgi:nicotinamide-nucleotide amidase